MLYRALDIFDFTPIDSWISSLFVQVVIVGPIEEFSKFLVFFIVSRKIRRVHDPVDGMVQAGAVALGFAVIENFKYGLLYGVSTLVARSFICTTGHVVFAMVWGFGYMALTYGVPGRRHRDTLLLFAFIFPAVPQRMRRPGSAATGPVFC